MQPEYFRILLRIIDADPFALLKHATVFRCGPNFSGRLISFSVLSLKVTVSFTLRLDSPRARLISFPDVWLENSLAVISALVSTQVSLDRLALLIWIKIIAVITKTISTIKNPSKSIHLI